MALIKCPECEKEISDTTVSCPHCGYKLSTDTGFRKTEISYLPAKKTTGMINILVGILLVLSGIISMFFIFTIILAIIGIIEIIFGAAMIKTGINNVKGTLQEADCPYCGKRLIFDENTANVKCQSCKQQSIKSQNHLTPIK